MWVRTMDDEYGFRSWACGLVRARVVPDQVPIGGEVFLSIRGYFVGVGAVGRPFVGRVAAYEPRARDVPRVVEGHNIPVLRPIEP